jgi:hypothetical protein
LRKATASVETLHQRSDLLAGLPLFDQIGNLNLCRGEDALKNSVFLNPFQYSLCNHGMPDFIWMPGIRLDEVACLQRIFFKITGPV